MISNGNFICIIVFYLFQTSISFKFNTLTNRQTNRINLNMKLFDNIDAILFDCDGVIAETERDGHRITFNKAFQLKGLTNEWSIEEYGELLKIGGGKERMTKYFNDVGWPASVSEDKRKDFVKELHLLKTDLFNEVVDSGAVPIRPGVARLIDEALANDIKVAVCSTSSDKAVTNIVRKLLGEERLIKIPIFAGDVVENKKPSPDIYLLAAKTLELDPKRCWVVEDSAIGLAAAKAAGMKCVVTKSYYTQDEDFINADIIIDNLDKGLDGPVTSLYLNYKASAAAYKPPTSTENAELFASTPNIANMFNKIMKGELGKGSPF